jgi:hypothetical protein
LNIHVLIVAQSGQLGPEGNIQRQGGFQRLVGICVGHHRHGGCEQISGDGHFKLFLICLKFRNRVYAIIPGNNIQQLRDLGIQEFRNWKSVFLIILIPQFYPGKCGAVLEATHI